MLVTFTLEKNIRILKLSCVDEPRLRNEIRLNDLVTSCIPSKILMQPTSMSLNKLAALLVFLLVDCNATQVVD